MNVQYAKTGEVDCKYNTSKATYGHCNKLSDPDCGVGCGASSTQDAMKRCSHFDKVE
jgi:hypothetical protein